MTLVAHFLGNGHMNIIVKNSRLIRTVWVMTRGATGCSNGIVHMLLDKDRLVGFMATGTEGISVIFQKQREFCRAVRVVTGKTPFFHRTMLEFDLWNLLPHCFVAIIAKRVARLQEIELVGGGMGIVAFAAVKFRDRFMNADCILGNQPAMAGSADPACVSGEQFVVR